MTSERNIGNHAEDELNDPVLLQALGNFRTGVNAWSDAEYHRPRTAVVQGHRIAWRRSVAWILSLALSLGIVGTAVYERHHQRVIPRALRRATTSDPVGGATTRSRPGAPMT